MLWQFQMGEGGTSPVSFSSNDCFKWVFIDCMDMHRVRSFSLAVLHGGGGHHLSLSHQMTISNGFSLVVWKHVAVTFLSSSFKWGEGRGEDIGQSRFICQIGAHFKFCSCFTELFCFYK